MNDRDSIQVRWESTMSFLKSLMDNSIPSSRKEICPDMLEQQSAELQPSLTSGSASKMDWVDKDIISRPQPTLDISNGFGWELDDNIWRLSTFRDSEGATKSPISSWFPDSNECPEKLAQTPASEISVESLYPVVQSLSSSRTSTTSSTTKLTSLVTCLDATNFSKTNGPKSPLREVAIEIGFCYSVGMSQFLSEYLTSGFAIELPRLLNSGRTSHAVGTFWPASILNLTLSATLLVFARLSDMYGGYIPFMSGLMWVAIWSISPAMISNPVVLDLSRAMQGLGLAASIPSSFAIISNTYPEGRRRNLVMGVYAGCAPLGFFVGLLSAATLPELKCFFGVASLLSLSAFVVGYFCMPSGQSRRCRLELNMDWEGSILICAGLVLMSYALSAVSGTGGAGSVIRGWQSPPVIICLAVGVVCLAGAFWYEGWVARCPLLPFEFFKPKSVKSLTLACLCFYATYGVWLYESADLFINSEASYGGIRGVKLALWYMPCALGGIILCITSGSLFHITPAMLLLFGSALAWIAAPLLLAVAPLPLDYWPYILPSMLCATLGIDLTYTVSVIFMSSVQPERYQGCAGAVCSMLVNLAISFALSICGIVSQTVETKALAFQQGSSPSSDAAVIQGIRAAFIYGSASAGLGFILCILFVRIPRSVGR